MSKLASQPMARTVQPHEHFVHLPTRLWKLLFAGGVVAWVFAAVITLVTKDNVLVPTVIIVGAIEELGKGAVLLAVAHQVHHREPRDGIVLGIVVGAGFAAFESAGYALQAMLDHLDHRSVVNILQTEAFRALLAPFGHITWTALLGGALFASSRGGRFHLTRRLVLTLLGVVTLHAIWDQSYGWAVMLTNGLISNEGWHLLWPNAQFWIVPQPARRCSGSTSSTTRCCGPTRSSASRGSCSPGVTTAHASCGRRRCRRPSRTSRAPPAPAAARAQPSPPRVHARRPRRSSRPPRSEARPGSGRCRRTARRRRA